MNHHRHHRHDPLKTRRRAAFTLIEMLVVIGIIAVLMAILVPVIGRVRKSAQAADSAAMISRLQGAIERYQQDFRAYPGPLSNNQLLQAATTAAASPFPDFRSGTGNNQLPVFVPAAFTSTIDDGGGRIQQANSPNFDTPVPLAAFTSITGAENLVLGLLGGLEYDSAAASGTHPVRYNPTLVGRGPMSLNPGDPRVYAAYGDATNLSWNISNGKKTGKIAAELGGANDSIVPEFMDRFSEPMPILYMRAKVGFPQRVTADLNGNLPTFRNSQYDLSQVIGYTASAVGTNRSFSGRLGFRALSLSTEKNGYDTSIPNTVHGLRSVRGLPLVYNSRVDNPPDPLYYYPFEGNLYLSNPAVSGTVRGKDSYVLIAAGPDRIYGTIDDATSFGQITP